MRRGQGGHCAPNFANVYIIFGKLGRYSGKIRAPPPAFFPFFLSFGLSKHIVRCNLYELMYPYIPYNTAIEEYTTIQIRARRAKKCTSPPPPPPPPTPAQRDSGHGFVIRAKLAKNVYAPRMKPSYIRLWGGQTS